MSRMTPRWLLIRFQEPLKIFKVSNAFVGHVAPLEAKQHLLWRPQRAGTQILELIQESSGSVTLVLQRPALQRLVVRRWNKERFKSSYSHFKAFSCLYIGIS